MCCRGVFDVFLALSTLNFWVFSRRFLRCVFRGVFAVFFVVLWCVFQGIFVGVFDGLFGVFLLCFRAAFVQNLEEHSSSFAGGLGLRRILGHRQDMGCPCKRMQTNICVNII